MKINAVEMMRSIRDRMSQEVQGMSPAEQIAYYRKRARRFDAWAEKRRAELAHRGPGEEAEAGVARPRRATAPAERRD